MSQDPKGFAAGDTNLYRYVGNDPTNSEDPAGTQPPKQGSDPYALKSELTVTVIMAPCAPVRTRWGWVLINGPVWVPGTTPYSTLLNGGAPPFTIEENTPSGPRIIDEPGDVPTLQLYLELLKF